MKPAGSINSFLNSTPVGIGVKKSDQNIPVNNSAILMYNSIPVSFEYILSLSWSFTYSEVIIYDPAASLEISIFRGMLM